MRRSPSAPVLAVALPGGASAFRLGRVLHAVAPNGGGHLRTSGLV